MLNDVIEFVTKFTGLSQAELTVVLLLVAVIAFFLSWFFIGDKEDDDSKVIISVGRGFKCKVTKNGR